MGKIVIRFGTSGIVLPLLMLLSVPLFAAPQPPSSYVTVIPGNVPIILAAPHGGTLSYPFPPRPCTGGQTCSLDTNTRLLAPKAADDFFALTGNRPYIVIAQGSREFIDLNRSKAGGTPNDAFDDPLAEPYYDYYHDTLQGFIDDIKLEYGRGLLLDIHGQSSVPGSVLRGTKDGLTTTDLLSAFGADALNGPNSIFGSLDALGYSVDPDVATPFIDQVENPNFNGGNTVQQYGSHQANGIDAIQIEFGINFRSGSNWEQTADDLATAMHNFYGEFLVDLPGDYNADGTVDAADYTVWRDNEGDTAGTLPNDVDGGAIGSDQYATWVANFGDVAPSAVAVPEPNSLVLLSLTALGFVMLMRGRRPITLLALTGVVVSISSPSYAAIETYTNQAAWEAALGGIATLEDFEGAAADVQFGLAYQPAISPNGDLELRANTNFASNALIDVSSFLSPSAGINGQVVVNLRFLDKGNGTNSQETVTVTLPSGISAFAFEYNNYDSAGDGTFLSLEGANAQVISAFDSSGDGFFGVVDTGLGASITSFAFTGDPTVGSQTSAFNSFDDVRYGIAGLLIESVPEPISLMLLSVIGIAALGRRKNKE